MLQNLWELGTAYIEMLKKKKIPLTIYLHQEIHKGIWGNLPWSHHITSVKENNFSS